MVRIQYVLVLAAFLVACDGHPYEPAAAAEAAAAAPAPAPEPAVVARNTPPAPAVTPPAAAIHRPVRAPVSERPPELDPAGVLDDEERRLLEADDATLTRQDRIARAEAQRKLVMADSEHPLHATLVALEADVASGRYAAMASNMWTGQAAFPERDEPGVASP